MIEQSPTIEPTEMSMVPPTSRTVIIIASRPRRVTELTMFSRFRGQEEDLAPQRTEDRDKDDKGDEQTEVQSVVLVETRREPQQRLADGATRRPGRGSHETPGS